MTKIQWVEQALTTAIQKARANGLNIRPDHWNVRPKLGFWDVEVKNACLCPMGALLLGMPSGILANASNDAADILGIFPSHVRSFTAGFDCTPATDMISRTDEFFQLGAKFRAAWDKENPKS